MRLALILSVIIAMSGATPGLAASASPDMRGPSGSTLHKHFYCVKNAESGACEDCWSNAGFSGARGTCRLLKSSTAAPEVRHGKCSAPGNTDFCKKH